MHFVVSWDIKAEGDAWDRANLAMKECLKGYSLGETSYYSVRRQNPPRVGL